MQLDEMAKIMQQTYTIPCQDGSDPECWGTLEERLHLVELSVEQVQQVIDDDQVELTAGDIDRNLLVLSPEQKKELADSGTVLWRASFRNTVCGACGSDG